MKVYIEDIEDIVICKRCGILMSYYVTKKDEDEWGNTKHECPVCKQINKIYRD